MLPTNPAQIEDYRRKIREGRAKQLPPFPKGTKFSEEHKKAISKSVKANPNHKSKRQAGQLNPNYKSGKTVDKNGYVLLSIDGKAVPEHRFVMQCKLGRPLLQHENVHHKNGNRQDNRLSNLELWSTKQPKGQRVEDKLEWAREIIALYGND